MVIMICFARSGGTILNKCLASLPNTVVMSEVNPINDGSIKAVHESPITVYNQALIWYRIKLKNKDFKGSIFELNEYCKNNGKILIIRDWTFVDFRKYINNNYRPSCRFQTIEALRELNPKILVITRDAIDVWISSGMPEIGEFFEDYLIYTKSIIDLKVPIFKYEDFTKKPKDILKNICEKYYLEYSDVINVCLDYNKVSGDNLSRKKSRGIKQKQIKPLSRKLISKEKIVKVNSCKDMIIANQLLEYPDNYYSAFSATEYLYKAIIFGFYQKIKSVFKYAKTEFNLLFPG